MSEVASFGSNTYAGKALIVPGIPVLTGKYSLLAGNLTRGAVVGQVLNGTPVGAAAAGNTGNGTIGTLSIGAGVKVGVYQIICVEPVTNLGTFEVEDPDGVIIGRAIAGTAFAGPIGFTIADGSTDFVAGDRFTVTVVAAAGKQVRLAVAAATDGSAVPIGVLADDFDASGGAVDCIVVERGDVMETALSFGAGHTADTVRDALKARGVVLVPSGR